MKGTREFRTGRNKRSEKTAHQQAAARHSFYDKQAVNATWNILAAK
jgi:hypothetical protein